MRLRDYYALGAQHQVPGKAELEKRAKSVVSWVFYAIVGSTIFFVLHHVWAKYKEKRSAVLESKQ